MANYDFDIGIVGGGSGGLTVAAGAAQLGAKTLLIEKKALGGDCLYYGCVPSKTLIRTAKIHHLLKNAESYGLPKAVVSPVDFRAVAGRIRSVIETIEKYDSVERFCRLGARVELGEPVFADDHTVRLADKTFSARYWVIATGSSPAFVPIPGLQDTPHLTNRDLFSLEKLPSSMIILGGGPVGIEMAQAFARLGTRVTVVQRDAQILSREDRDMADQLMEILAGEGVLFYLNAFAVKVRDLGSEKEVTLMIGKETREVRAETILSAMGRDANLNGLGLKELGVHFERTGLMTDGRMRTNIPHIFAVGDATGKYQFTHAAAYEGGIVIANTLFRYPRKADYTFLPWCTYTDPELASIGMNERAAKGADIAYSVWTEEFRNNDRSLAEGEPSGKIKMILDERERPVGIQILGSGAGELISEWVAVLNGRVGLSTLAYAVHPYPTLAEINKRVAGSLMAGKLFSTKVRKGLKFFFSLKGRACELPHGDR
jgi:pyruvate/2-oxoglutarate dehydrogenase complex dihydrolipoamide dehydrogenase (E3) component